MSGRLQSDPSSDPATGAELGSDPPGVGVEEADAPAPKR
jgi:hypothetical protein